MDKYEVIIYWSKEDNAFIAEAPELPGCIAHGVTHSKALANLKSAMKLWIRTAKDKPVKTFIKYLREVENLPDDGQVAFEEEFIELISKTPNLLADNKKELKSEMFWFIGSLGSFLLAKGGSF